MGERLDKLLDEAVAASGVRGRVLNLPAGEGRLTARLEARGLDVTSADLFPEDCRLGTKPAVLADMNERLPFDDGAFDAVVSQEGIEHLENPARFLRECGRVLKDGGHLWITTPNVMDLSSRVAFLLAGQRSFPGGLPTEDATLWGGDGDRLYHGHAFTLPFFQIRYLLRIAHFDEIELRPAGWSTTSCVLYPFLLPFIALTGPRLVRRRQRRDRKKNRKAASDAVVRELNHATLSRPLLCGKTLFLQARRPNSFNLGSGESSSISPPTEPPPHPHPDA